MCICCIIGSVYQQLGESQRFQIRENREYLTALLDAILFLCKQELALRGHREDKESENKGNFLELLDLLSKRDPDFRKRYESRPGNASYTHPEIQNELIDASAHAILNQIRGELTKAEYWAPMVDEMRDCSCKELMAICIRYYHGNTIHERCISVVEAKKLDAASLTDLIQTTLSLMGLDPHKAVAQCYDGAVAMSGVQARMREKYEKAVYVHCWAHKLNLVLVNACSDTPHVLDFFSTLQSLYTFFSGSTLRHSKYLDKQKELHPEDKTHKLQSLSDTRWNSRFHAINAVIKSLDSLVEVLDELGQGGDDDAVKARGLLASVQSKRFVFLLVMFNELLSMTNKLSECLQSVQVDLAKAVRVVSAVKETLESKRSDKAFDDVWKTFEDLWQNLKLVDVESELERLRRPRQFPARLQDGMVETTVGNRQQLYRATEYRCYVYFPVLDNFLAEMNRRFSDESTTIMKAVQACTPGSDTFFDPIAIKEFCQFYDIDLAIQSEIEVARKYLSTQDLKKTTVALLDALPVNFFPHLTRMLQIMVTIPVSSATCERVNSCLKRIKNSKRSTMLSQI